MADPRFLSGTGEMAARLRSHAWATTPLGQAAAWPRALKTLVGVMLAAKQPMFLAWGPARVMLYNDAYATLLQSKHPRALGQPFTVVWAEIWDDIAPLVDQVFAGEPVHMDDITLQVARNGETAEAHFAFSYTPVFGDEGDVVGLFCPCNETTGQILMERAAAEALQAAEEANVAKSQFLANMSHELRTPLSAIIGYAEMLLEEADEGASSAELAGDIRKIEGNARHLLGLINDVLDLSKIEAGKMEVYAETFVVADLVRETAGTAEALVAKKRNRLELVLADDLGTMHSDVTKIRQILLNLLSNAAKFTEGGTITLAVARQGDPATFVFTVRDTGIGMTHEQRASLFERFQQADASTTRKFGGTGLGLSLTKGFSAMLGGEVAVESILDRGSTFTVSLPAAVPDGGNPANPIDLPQTAASPQDLAELGSGPKADNIVLVIDDDVAQRELMTRFLSREGFQAVTAAEGRTGLALARELHPRAILLDVMMPGMDGWAVLSQLKADPVLATVPVVMVTFVSERALADTLGAADFVAKPVRWERFRAVMDRFRDAAGDVLVVDDDAEARARVRHALERDGWTVSEAENGRAALDVVAVATPRVILLDLTMPVMDGFAFLHALRDRPGGAEIPVIILSARDLTGEERARLGSAAQVLTKSAVSLRGVVANVRAVVVEPDP